MLSYQTIVNLYNNVIENDVKQYRISDDAIRTGIAIIREVYRHEGRPSLMEDVSAVADFNDAAHRCAYLHKFAALHTTMVSDVMLEAMQKSCSIFQGLVESQESFKICSLGGGPGSDIIGILASLCTYFGCRVHPSVTVVDYMEEWSYSLSSILKELESGSYGVLGGFIGKKLLWRYIGANLLKPLTLQLELEISSSLLISMVKFVSAASCKETEFMIDNIFTAMRPGAMLLFIDNSGGGFQELITKVAELHHFIPIFGPIQHEIYSKEAETVNRFGARRCNKIRITKCIYQKPLKIEPRLRITIPNSKEYALFPLNSKRSSSSPCVVSCTTSRSRIHSKTCCLPLAKFKKWRHQLSRKLDKMKFRSCSLATEKSRKRKKRKSSENFIK